MSHYKQGFFKPKNPQKYKGNPSNIVYRSSLELKFLIYLDNHPQVIKYASEEPFMIVPYINPITGKTHRYYPDMWFQKLDNKGCTITYLIEIKPFSQTQPPKITHNPKSKKNIKAISTYAINKKKWDAAKLVCEKNGWDFKIITDRELK